MAEPTTSSLPISYDAATTLLGRLVDQRNLALYTTVDSDDTDIVVEGFVNDIELPAYLVWAGGEVMFVETMNGSLNGWTGVLRGVRGSTPAAHTAGEVLFLVYDGKHATLMREALLKAEKYQGLAGLLTARPTSPHVSEVFVATDEGKVYFSVGLAGQLSQGTWRYVGRTDHAELDGRADDDHANLHIDSRALAWHGGLAGGHVTGGDGHDHLGGNGAGRVEGGDAVNIPASPSVAGEVYYAEDTEVLYLGLDISDWVAITGAPAGAIAGFSEAAIAAFGGACPPGWSRFTALDDRFPVGAPAGKVTGLTNVGTDAHAHTYTAVLQHSHSVAGFAAAPGSSGTHSHSIPLFGNIGSGDGIMEKNNSTPQTSYVTAGGLHTHTVDKPGDTTSTTKRTSDGAAGVATGTSGTPSVKPPHRTAVFCQRS